MKKVLLFVALALFLFFTFIEFYSPVDQEVKMAFVAAWVALWWIFEVMPLSATALIPLVAYPCLGILKVNEVAPVYMSSVLFLFIGGFLMAIAMQKWNFHRRLAINIVLFFGQGLSKMLLGFMVATAFLSMWISNTASTVMMFSIAMAIITQYEELVGENEASRKVCVLLMLAIAYSATIGGIGTLIGTPPNLAFTRIYSMNFPHLNEVSFGQWISFGLPMVVILIVSVWLYFRYLLNQDKNIQSLDHSVLLAEKQKLGRFSREERIVAMAFTTMAIMWIFRKDLSLGFFTLPGWSRLMPFPEYLDDGMVAIVCSLSLFLISSRDGKRILVEGDIARIPWRTILLFGGGFALAKGMVASGLSSVIGQKFIALKDVDPALTVVFVTIGMSYFTELTSNMASTEMILPLLASIAKTTGLSPAMLMVPATLSASAAFMFPAATAPNAIIFGSNKIKMKEMVKIGFVVNILAIIVMSLFSIFIVPRILN